MTLLVLAGCSHHTEAELLARAERHADLIGIPGADGCRGTPRVLAGESPVGCVPGPPIERDRDEGDRFCERIKTLPDVADPRERAWMAIAGFRSGSSCGWTVAGGQWPFIPREYQAEVARWLPGRDLAVSVVQWDNALMVLDLGDPELRDAWFRYDEALENARPWDIAAVADVRGGRRAIDELLPVHIPNWIRVTPHLLPEGAPEHVRLEAARGIASEYLPALETCALNTLPPSACARYRFEVRFDGEGRPRATLTEEVSPGTEHLSQCMTFMLQRRRTPPPPPGTSFGGTVIAVGTGGGDDACAQVSPASRAPLADSATPD